MVRPLRREIETFGFRTVSLDIRQNSDVINGRPRDLAAQRHPRRRRPEPGQPGWSAKLRSRTQCPEDPTRFVRALGPGALRAVDAVRPDRRDAARRRPEGVGAFISEHDRSRGRPAGGLCAGKYAGLSARAASGFARRSFRCSRRSTISGRAGILRELSRFRWSGAASGPAATCSGSDARLFGLQQGRRLPVLDLGADQGAKADRQRRAHTRRRGQLLSRPRRLGQPRRCADRPGDRRAAGRHGGGRMRSPSRARWCRRNTPTAARRSISWSS